MLEYKAAGIRGLVSQIKNPKLKEKKRAKARKTLVNTINSMDLKRLDPISRRSMQRILRGK